ncbi:MAG: 3-deoxy-D-manno-octulosonic acid transferase [Magnetococcales bacterium]|nr:3-deoxy-D-manno-octulosonic acid transferase [Magnetococcales bacterium]
MSMFRFFGHPAEEDMEVRIPEKCLYGLYTGVISLAGLGCLPFWILRIRRSLIKYQGTVAQRFGQLPTTLCQDLATRECFWVHAVSVGEALAAQGLVEKLHHLFPHWRVVVSTVTKTGQQVVHDRFAHVDHTLYLPLDLPWIVRRVVARIRPRFVIVMETELWPNLFHALERAAIPIILVNGRLSPRSFTRYRHIRWAMARFLQPVHLFCMQSAGDAERLRQLQAPSHSPQGEPSPSPNPAPNSTYPQRMCVTGNLKYDQALRLPDPTAMATLRQRLGAPADPIWLAASTHPGEEEIVLDGFSQVRQQHPDLRLILVPRHPERTGTVAGIISRHGLPFSLFSQTRGSWPQPLLLVDEIGWLTRLYGVARIVFVGGSLIPHGGQNFLEPAAWGIPPMFGPHTFNFKDATQQFLAARAAFQVADVNALATTARMLLHNPAQRDEAGQRAQDCVLAHTGALERTVRAIQAILTPHISRDGKDASTPLAGHHPHTSSDKVEHGPHP